MNHQLFHKDKLTVALVGNPNSGKSTLFNALTGSKQKVGNWPGVTVERKSGFLIEDQKTLEIVDLPGLYSLVMVSEESSIDERIACDFILNQQADVILNIIDANNLERNLYLTLQLLEMGVPMVIALNMMDVAKQNGKTFSIKKLEKRLGCPVIPLEANKKNGIKALKQALFYLSHTKRNEMPWHQGWIKKAIQSMAVHISHPKWVSSEWMALRWLEGDFFVKKSLSIDIISQLDDFKEVFLKNRQEDIDILIADSRYQFIEKIINECVTKKTVTHNWTQTIDNIVLNRILGIPIFLGVMYSLFLFAINIGGAFQDFFDITSNTLFVEGLIPILNELRTPNWLTVLLANGIGKGINTTVTFIPVIGAMFLFLAFLEDSGYMARAAFVVDRLMRAMGLPGKSFVPMIVGFGCNVPAVMAARTLENPRDRILTVIMSPFMSCGARLAIYAVFTAAFFPTGGQNIVFSLYLIGIVMAVLTGLFLRKTVLKGEPAPLVMELPPYHFPKFTTLFLHAWQRLKGFVFRAGKLIIPICILIGTLNALNVDGTIGEGDSQSILSSIGRLATPIFSPMGIHQDNWPATVGLMTGVLAKEVVVGTLNTLYSQIGHFAELSTGFDFWANIHAAFLSIPQNLAELGHSLGNPVLAKAPVHTLEQGVYGLMYQRFDEQIGAISYLLFVLLYFPCVSTMAVMMRELNRSWAIFSAIWTTGIAYCAAVFFYQAATWVRHPISSTSWILGIIGVFIFSLMSIRMYADNQTRHSLLKVESL